MKTNLLLDFSVDKSANKMIVKREFAAPLNNVWAAWTEPELLDQWWAPKPWKAHTKSMAFKEGGIWLYSMTGPEGEEHWVRADYKSIQLLQGWTATDSFCDSEGNINTELPQNNWKTSFTEGDSLTTVVIETTFASLEDLEKIIEMGMIEGLTMAMETLDEVLKK